MSERNPACRKECLKTQRDDLPMCHEEDDSGDYCCTRIRGHKGPHVACGDDEEHAMKVWKNVAEPEEESSIAFIPAHYLQPGGR